MTAEVQIIFKFFKSYLCLSSNRAHKSAFPTYSWQVHPANQCLALRLNLSEFSHTMHHKGREKANYFDITENRVMKKSQEMPELSGGLEVGWLKSVLYHWKIFISVEIFTVTTFQILLTYVLISYIYIYTISPSQKISWDAWKITPTD